MDEYIEKNRLIRDINNLSTHPLNSWDTLGILCVIDKQPILDVKPVVHGEWLTNKEDGFIEIAPCSVCGEVNDIDYNFCPNCGADMRGEKKK